LKLAYGNLHQHKQAIIIDNKKIVGCFMKKILLILLLFIAIFSQMIFNPSGYNYIVYWMCFILLGYFDEIKSVSFGILKIEKYEKIARYLQNAIVASWKTTIDLNLIQKSFFASERILLPNTEEFLKTVELIQKEMPQDIQSELDEYVKQKANILAQQQDNQIVQYKETQHNDLPSAEEASQKLHNIAKYGIKKMKIHEKNIDTDKNN
jgi:hypothetical protein